MKPSMRVDTRGFQAFIRELAQRANKRPEEVLPVMVGRVLSNAVKFTKKTTLKKAVEGAKKHATADHNLYGGGKSRKRGAARELPRMSITKNGVWWLDHSKDGRLVKYKMDDPNRHWGDARWRNYIDTDTKRKMDLQIALAKAEKAARESRGLAARAWVEIGELLGVPVDAPAYVRNAKPSNGKTYDNAIGKRGKLMGTHYIDIGTRQPILTSRIDGYGVLRRAVRVCLTAFQNDIKYGVFEDAQRAAARYPGIFVKPS